MRRDSIPRTAVVVFARGQEAEAKGLASSPVESAQMSELLLRRTLETVARLPASVGLVLATDQEVPSDWLSPLGPLRTRHLHRQSGEGFEVRILGALEHARRLGYERLVVVGVDTPSMSTRDLRRACERQNPVLGPSEDGGFYLLGLNVSELDRLVGLPWCSSELVTVLRRAFRELDLEERPVRADLDRRVDVSRQQSRLERLALRLLGRPLGVAPPCTEPATRPAPRSWNVRTVVSPRGPPLPALGA